MKKLLNSAIIKITKTNNRLNMITRIIVTNIIWGFTFFGIYIGNAFSQDSVILTSQYLSPKSENLIESLYAKTRIIPHKRIEWTRERNGIFYLTLIEMWELTLPDFLEQRIIKLAKDPDSDIHLVTAEEIRSLTSKKDFKIFTPPQYFINHPVKKAVLKNQTTIKVECACNIHVKINIDGINYYLLIINKNLKEKTGAIWLAPLGGKLKHDGVDVLKAIDDLEIESFDADDNDMHFTIKHDQIDQFLKFWYSGEHRELSPLRELEEEISETNLMSSSEYRLLKNALLSNAKSKPNRRLFERLCRVSS